MSFIFEVTEDKRRANVPVGDAGQDSLCESAGTVLSESCYNISVCGHADKRKLFRRTKE